MVSAWTCRKCFASKPISRRVDLIEMGNPQTREKTPRQLREFAAKLDEASRKIKEAAQSMLNHDIPRLSFRYAPGADADMLTSIIPFADNAATKVAKEIRLRQMQAEKEHRG